MAPERPNSHMVVLSSGSRNSRRGAGGAPASRERLPPPPLGECGYGMNRQARRTGPQGPTPGPERGSAAGRKPAGTPRTHPPQPAARRRLKGIVPSRQTMRYRISGPNRVWIRSPARLYCRHASIERDCDVRGRRQDKTAVAQREAPGASRTGAEPAREPSCSRTAIRRTVRPLRRGATQDVLT